MASTRQGNAAAPEGARFAARGIAEIAPDGVDAPTVPLLLGFAVLAVRAILAPILDPGLNDLASAVAQVIVASLACVSVMLGLRHATDDHRHYGVRVLAGLILVLVLSVAESIVDVLPANEWLLLAVYIVAVGLTVYQLTPLVAVDLPRSVHVAAWLDMLIFFASGLAVAASLAAAQGVVVSDATVAVMVATGATVAWAATSASMLFVRGVRLWFGGPFVLVLGIALVAVACAAWIAKVDISSLVIAGPADFVFAAGVLLIARGWLTWSVEARARRNAWLVEAGRDTASTAAIMLAIIVGIAFGPDRSAGGTTVGAVAQIALICGVVVAGIRQGVLKEYERRARYNEATTSARLVSEISDRGRVARALEGLEPASSIAVTAERICERLLSLPCAGFVIVSSLSEDGEGTPLAASGMTTYGLVGEPLPEDHAQHLRQQAARGTWVESARPWLDPWLPAPEPGVEWAVVRAPLVWEDHLLGLLTVGGIASPDPDQANRTLATVREASVLVAALVGPSLAVEAAMRRRRKRIDSIIADHAFAPVYQPIVELATGRTVGYEALTRFSEGGRPDLVFQEADLTGRGAALEVATLHAAVAGSSELPETCYLSLNLSAEIASSVDFLGRVLTRLPRAILLEITEHVPVEDYERMMANLYALDIKIRLAVDDAGAGYAGLQHILAIRPHVVKLDAALVRSVDTDVARQAMVEAMVSFAGKTGCKIVAEGVETASEVAKLRSLGVDLAQGYFFGRPATAADCRAAFASSAASGSPAATTPGAPSSAPAPSC